MTAADFVALTRPLPEAWFLVEGGGEILAANDAAASLLGRRDDPLAGTRLSDLVTDPDDVVRTFLRMAAHNGSMIPGRLTFRAADGEDRACRCRGAAVRSWSAEEPAHLVIQVTATDEEGDRFLLLNRKIGELSREIHRRRALEEERERLLASAREARAKAEEAMRAKDRFLATISHELRTPLNAIIGWASLLRQGSLDGEKVDRALHTIERAANAQNHLINDLLDVSRILAGKLRLDLRPLNVSNVADAAAETVRPMAQTKGIRLQTRLDPDAGPVNGDADRLQQIVWNLASNAIKFTPSGGRVQIRVQRVEPNVEIAVSDTGVGIDSEVLPFIFDRFRQGQTATEAGHEGVGLGLSIVKYLVEMQGGTVYAESPGEGLGSTFTVTLPLTVFQQPDALTEDDETRPPPAANVEWDLESAADLGGARILVVENKAASQDMFATLLRQAGAEVHSVDSVSAAWDALEKHPPQIIVSDVDIPDEDSYAFIEKLRTRPPERGSRIPAVAVTAVTRTVDRIRTFQAGFQMHVAKPVEPREFVVVVASLLEPSA